MSSVIRKDLTVEENARWLLKGFGRGRLMADSMVIFRGTTVEQVVAAEGFHGPFVS
jgi:hypothetical protein